MKTSTACTFCAEKKVSCKPPASWKREVARIKSELAMGVRAISPVQVDTPGGMSDIITNLYTNHSTVSGSGASARRTRAPRVPKASEGLFAYSP